MDNYLGTILAFGFNFAPRGWLLCEGQILQIAPNTALFSLLGTTYGGDGVTTFAVPDLRGRCMVGQGQGQEPTLSPITIGEKEGAENTSLLATNIPMHAHPLVEGQANVVTVLNARSGSTLSNDPDNGNNSLAAGGTISNIYSEPGGTSNKVGGIASTISGVTGLAGGGQSFSIRNPYLGINYSIALEGVYPSRN